MNCKAIYFNLATLDAYLIEVKDGEYYFITKKNAKTFCILFLLYVTARKSHHADLM